MNNSKNNFAKTEGFKIKLDKLNNKMNMSSTMNNINTHQNFNSTAFSQTSNFRLYGMSSFQSVNSLQNSVYSWTFNKADRWKGGTYRQSITNSLYSLPNSLNTRSTTFGSGQRKDLRPIPGRESPSPDRYDIRSIFDRKKGKSISIKFKHPQDTYIHVPGPGTYNIQGDPNKGNIPVTMKSRVRLFYEDDLAKQKHCLSPQKYHPITKLEENLRYRNITFGHGERSPSVNPSSKSTPGPGAYNLPSVFDKTRKFKISLN